MPDQNNEQTNPTRVQSNDSTQNNQQGQTQPMRAQSTPPPGVSVPPTSQPTGSETQPVAVMPTPINQPKKSKRWPWFLLGILLILIFGGLGTYFGYRAAINLRKASQAEQLVTVATEHFMLGIQAQQKGQFEIARQQFEFVISKDPGFPGAAEKLTEVLIAMAATTTPTIQPSATAIPITPTPDLRGQEEIYNTARQQFVNQDWDNLMQSIDALRTLDPSYRAIDVDGMLYVAYRYRGIRKIYQEANLEGGIYDLALAERFAPLDSDADGARNWARMYLNGVSFWGADWGRVALSFEQIYPYFPNLRDSTGMTATERYRYAAIEQGKVLQNQEDGCGALEFYNKALAIAGDADVEEKAAEAYLMCYPPTETPQPTPSATMTVEVVATTEAPVEPPTVEAPPAEATPSLTPNP